MGGPMRQSESGTAADLLSVVRASIRMLRQGEKRDALTWVYEIISTKFDSRTQIVSFFPEVAKDSAFSSLFDVSGILPNTRSACFFYSMIGYGLVPREFRRRAGDVDSIRLLRRSCTSTR